MKKIAVFVYDYTLFGGAERVAVNLANELCRDYEVSLISCFDSRKVPSFPLNEKVHSFVLSEETISMSLHCSSLAHKLRTVLRENHIDVILNITAGVNTVSWLATRGTVTKVIYCEHSNLVNKTYGKKHEFRQWLGAKTADKVITLTEADQVEFQKKYGLGSKADYIYNWYDGPVSKNYDSNSQKIIAVGRLEYVKGYDRMIQAAEKVFAKHPDWTLDIYGEGTYRESITQQIAEAHLENNIFLKGNYPAVIQEYSSHAFCVMTSYYEGFALTLVEALANSLPTVSFDCPTGPREIVQDGINGLLVENGAIDALADAMNRLIENPALRREFSTHATDILKNFDKETIYQQWVRTIEAVTAHR